MLLFFIFDFDDAKFDKKILWHVTDPDLVASCCPDSVAGFELVFVPFL